MSYILEVVIADTSTLRNRSLAFAFSSSPYIATTFAGPAAAERFYKTSGSRRAFGYFATLTSVLSTPIFAILYINQRKAKKAGLLVKEFSRNNILQSILHHLVEFDGSQVNQWKSATTISMIVVGLVLLIVVRLWERFFAPKTFILCRLLFSRTSIGVCLLSATLFIAYYRWDGYCSSYLQVVNGLSISDAGYVTTIYNIGSCLWAIVVAYFIRITGTIKCLPWVALPVQMLGGGLMIYFRQLNIKIGYVIMCQIFIAFAGGTLVICEQMAVMAITEHGDVASMLALLTLFAYVGGAIGSSVSGAI